MITQLRTISSLAIELRDGTSIHDPRRPKLQTIIDTCGKISDHYIDDGK